MEIGIRILGSYPAFTQNLRAPKLFEQSLSLIESAKCRVLVALMRSFYDPFR